jgi:hypothetical protein
MTATPRSTYKASLSCIENGLPGVSIGDLPTEKLTKSIPEQVKFR